MKTSELRHQPEARGDRANDRAQSIPRVGAAYRGAGAVLRWGFWSSNQDDHCGKIEAEDYRRGQHGQRACGELSEHEAAKRFVRRAQKWRKRFDEVREEHEE